jgi:hypothetical protein
MILLPRSLMGIVMDELTRRRRQAELQRIDAWLQKLDRENPFAALGIAALAALVILWLAVLLERVLCFVSGAH